MRRTTLTFVLLLFPVVADSQSQSAWSKTPSGCEWQTNTLQDSGSGVGYILFRCDPKISEVKIVDTASTLGKTNPYAAFSLRELLNETHASIVVNAGSTTSFSVPSPAGLLRVGGKTINPPRLHVKNAGVLCIRRDRLDIVRFSATLPKGCLDAVQRGPFLSQDLTQENDSSARFRRTVVAVDGGGRLVILVTKDGTRLSAISALLFEGKLNLDIRAALNMDGAASSGLIVADDQGVKDSVIGNVDGLVASAIAIRKRR